MSTTTKPLAARIAELASARQLADAIYDQWVHSRDRHGPEWRRLIQPWVEMLEREMERRNTQNPLNAATEYAHLQAGNPAFRWKVLAAAIEIIHRRHHADQP